MILHVGYIKLYLTVHLKHWWVYLLSIGTLFIGYVFSMFGVFFGVSLGFNGYLVWIIQMIIGTLIFSAPLVYVNYKVALEYCLRSDKKCSVASLTFCNHILTYLLYLGIFLLVSYSG